MAVVSKYKRVPGFTQEVDKVSVMPRRNVSQSGVRRVDVSCDGRLQELSQRRSVVGQRLDPPSAAVPTAATVMVVVMVVLARVSGTAGRMGTRHARSCHGTPTQNVRQHCRTLHVLHKKRNHVGQLGLAQGMA